MTIITMIIIDDRSLMITLMTMMMATLMASMMMRTLKKVEVHCWLPGSPPSLPLFLEPDGRPDVYDDHDDVDDHHADVNDDDHDDNHHHHDEVTHLHPRPTLPRPHFRLGSHHPVLQH